MSDRTILVVGCLNRGTSYFPGARGKGIAVFAFDGADGRLVQLSEKAGIDKPDYLEVDERAGCLYAVSEVSGWNEGVVTAFASTATPAN